MRSVWAIIGMIACWLSAPAMGQDPRVACMIPLFRDNMLPGQVGRMQLERDPRLRDYFQPVQFRGPRGMTVALAEGNQFTDPLPCPSGAAFLVGCVYRVKLGGIPQHEGEELFPTVEVIDRLYPPAEREHRFPIPIEFDEEDLDRALSGEMVMRVVYLEDSEIAAPVSDADGIQRVYELTGREDALQTADRMGRPMAIVRLGSRVPSQHEITSEFLYGCPPWQALKALPNREKLIEEYGWPRIEYPVMEPKEARVGPRGSEVRPASAEGVVRPRNRAATGKIGG